MSGARRRRATAAALLAALAVPLSGCGADGDAGDDAGDDVEVDVPLTPPPDTPPPPPPRPLPELPDRIEDTILVEGTPQPIIVRRVDSPAGFPLPFATLAGEDFDVETEAGEAPAVRFVARFGGVRNQDAVLELVVHPAGTSREEAERRASEALRFHDQPVPREERRFDGSVGEWRIGEASPVPAPEVGVGHVALGERDGRYFHLVSRYPAEYGDGFPPRAAVILESWRWADGSPLLGG